MPRKTVSLLILAAIAAYGLTSRRAPAADPVYDPYAATTVTQVRDPFGDGRIRMIFRLDDAGFCHAANAAIERVMNEGVVTAVSVMVTTPWLDEAVEMLAKHPEVSVGVHTALNSEWLPYRWGPVLPPKEVPSLVDEWGKFYGTRKQMMARVPNLDELEAELRAQVELARRKGLRLSYMDHHMSGAVTTPQMRDRFARVAKDSGLGVSRWFGETQGPLIYSVEPEKKADFLVEEIRKIDKPGLYLVVCHVGLDVPEMSVLRDQNTSAPQNMSRHRQAETDALCDPRLKQVIREKNIELVGYDVLRERFMGQMRPPEVTGGVEDGHRRSRRCVIPFPAWVHERTGGFRVRGGGGHTISCLNQRLPDRLAKLARQRHPASVPTHLFPKYEPGNGISSRPRFQY